MFLQVKNSRPDALNGSGFRGAMRILKLVMKKVHFDEVLSGNKKKEVREIRPQNSGRYCVNKPNGEFEKIRDYDAIEMFVGYHKDRASLLIETTGAEIFVLKDKITGKDLTYTEKGVEYVEAQIHYKLGKILKTHNC